MLIFHCNYVLITNDPDKIAKKNPVFVSQITEDFLIWVPPMLTEYGMVTRDIHITILTK